MALNLPTLAEMAAQQYGKPIPKGETRLQAHVKAKALVNIDEKAFRAEVWHRDKSKCRCCGRKVAKVLGRVPERGEVHHVHGRTGDLRFESRSALLSCLTCHERLTGRVNDKLVIVPSKTFTTRQGTFTDARFPVTFRKVA